MEGNPNDRKPIQRTFEEWPEPIRSMTASELIEALENFDSDMEVCAGDSWVVLVEQKVSHRTGAPYINLVRY